MTAPETPVGSGGLFALIDQATRFGTPPTYVQGAGGNLSVKSEGSIWIKASGTRFKEARERNIFVELDQARASELVLDSEDLSALVLEQDAATPLRPSIETAIHTLLPQRFVSHVHAVGPIALAIGDDARDRSQALADLARVVFVDYARPGIPLARAILTALSTEPVSADEDLLVILGNHGIIGASSSAATVVRLIEQAQSRTAAPAPADEHTGPARTVEEGWIELCPAGTLNTHQIDLLRGGALTPDQAVFMGAHPFAREQHPSDGSPALAMDDGSVLLQSSASADAREIAESFIDIARAFTPGRSPRYLSEKDIDELVNWDAEKWRKEQER